MGAWVLLRAAVCGLTLLFIEATAASSASALARVPAVFVLARGMRLPLSVVVGALVAPARPVSATSTPIRPTALLGIVVARLVVVALVLEVAGTLAAFLSQLPVLRELLALGVLLLLVFAPIVPLPAAAAATALEV